MKLDGGDTLDHNRGHERRTNLEGGEGMATEVTSFVNVVDKH